MRSCSMERFGRWLIWLSIVSASARRSLVVSQQDTTSESPQQPLSSSCYSGIAKLRLISPDANRCITASAKTRPLTSPMDFSTDLPWDCLNALTVSVSGCKVSLISAVTSSNALPNFACNWIEYQGYIQSDTKAHLAAWTRPISATRWILYNTNLTSWRAHGTATVTLDDVQKAIKSIISKDPSLPVSSLLDQPEMLQLQANSMQFQQQLQQQQQQQQQPAVDAANAGRRLSHARKLQQQVDSSSSAAPSVAKPPLPPGVEADIGNGLVSQPINWQKRLADVIQSNGSVLIGFPENNTIVLYNNERCNITYEIMSGGLLGAGSIDSSTVGTFAMPSLSPFEPPMIMDVDRQVLAAAAAVVRSNQGAAEPTGDCRALKIFVIVILCVLGAALLGALVYLVVRLSKAPKAAAAAATGRDDLVLPEGVAMSPLEQQARALGPSGGL